MRWPDPFLHGNGVACPACAPRPREDCRYCGGTGRVPLAPEEIIRRQLEENRRGRIQ